MARFADLQQGPSGMYNVEGSRKDCRGQIDDCRRFGVRVAGLSDYSCRWSVLLSSPSIIG